MGSDSWVVFGLQECGFYMMDLEWRKGASPLKDGSQSLLACVVCSERVASLCKAKSGKIFVARRGGRGRGRGRRGRGRGRSRGRENPLMSFREF